MYYTIALKILETENSQLTKDLKTCLYKKAVLVTRNGRKIELKPLNSKLSIYPNEEDVLEIDEAQPEVQDLLFLDHANEPNLTKLFKKKISANSLETLLGSNIIHLKPVSMQKQRGKSLQALKTFNSYFGQNVYALKNEDLKATSFDVLVLTGTYFSGIQCEPIYNNQPGGINLTRKRQRHER
jgi:hypothetical protein